MISDFDENTLFSILQRYRVILSIFAEEKMDSLMPLDVSLFKIMKFSVTDIFDRFEVTFGINFGLEE